MINAFLIDSVLQRVEGIELAMGDDKDLVAGIQEKLGVSQVTFFVSSDWDRVYFDAGAQAGDSGLCFKMPNNERTVFGKAVVVGMYLNTDEPMAEGPVINMDRLKQQLRFFNRKEPGGFMRKLKKQQELKFNEPDQPASLNE